MIPAEAKLPLECSHKSLLLSLGLLRRRDGTCESPDRRPVALHLPVDGDEQHGQDSDGEAHPADDGVTASTFHRSAP
jgi:hypothetical protein